MVISFAWFVPVILGWIILWFAAHQLAPVGCEVKPSRALGAAILLKGVELLVDMALKTHSGDWIWWLVFLIGALLVIKIVLSMGFWRSLGVGVAYCIGIFGVHVAIGSLIQEPNAH
jgi:hypothetical protein